METVRGDLRKKLIEVDSDCIDCGEKCSATDCPTAKAIHDAGFCLVTVGLNSIHYRDGECYIEITTPAEVKAKIQAFENHE